MNPLKYAFGVLAGKFLGFIIHEKDIEIDPKRIEAMKKVGAPTCMKDLQKFMGRTARGFYSYSSIKRWSWIYLVAEQQEA